MTNLNEKDNLYTIVKASIQRRDAKHAKVFLVRLLEVLDKEYSVADDANKDWYRKVISSLLDVFDEICGKGLTDRVLTLFAAESMTQISDMISDDENSASNAESEGNAPIVSPVQEEQSDSASVDDDGANIDVDEPAQEDVNSDNLTKSFPIEFEETQPVTVDRKARKASELRPQTLDDYIGQEDIKALLRNAINASKNLGQMPPHMLFFGPAGLGKTSLAKIVAKELGVDIITINGAHVKDLVSSLAQLKDRAIVFIDEIHATNPKLLETIYGAMTDFELSYTVENGPDKGKNVTVDLPEFTLIGATTHAGLLRKPMLDRCAHQFKFVDYTIDELERIVKVKAVLLGIEVGDDVVKEVAKRCKGVPRKIESIMTALRELAANVPTTTVTMDMCLAYFDSAHIDPIGLEQDDIKILSAIMDNGGAPLGLKTIAGQTGIEEVDISEHYEPYLLRLGFIKKLPNGRVCTEAAYQYFGKEFPSIK